MPRKHPAASRRGKLLGSSPRWRLFGKYALLISALVCLGLMASSLIGLYFSYQETRAQLFALQREKAVAAAGRIEQFIIGIEQQIGWTTLLSRDDSASPIELRRFEYLKLLRQVPAITEVSWLDENGREQLRVSRVALDVVGSGADFSRDVRFTAVKAGTTWFSPVYFRKDTEPYLTISRPAGDVRGGAAVAEVNLKFVWDVISRIKVGETGLAYVVDSGGTLIAHPDISLVLKKTVLSHLHQAALQKSASATGDEAPPIDRDMTGREVLTAQAAIPILGWRVIVDLPAKEAFAPISAALARAAVLLLVGLILSVVASLVLARRMVDPIRALQAGADEIGAGKLDHRIAVDTGDELEGLADQFNAMAARLQESYADLERKVEERTADLQESLEHQTATSEILRVIAGSPSDLQPVFDIIAERAARLCGGNYGLVFRFDGEWIQLASIFGMVSEGAEAMRQRYPLRPGSDSVAARTVSEGAVVNVGDVLALPEYAHKDAARIAGFRAAMGVPMVRQGQIVGAITVTRAEVGLFSDKQTELLQTFASQAVIAIENVRLFQELQARTQALARSVEELRALGEVGQAVSSTLDLQTVLTTIVTRATQLSGSNGGVIYEFHEATQSFQVVATDHMAPEHLEALQAMPVRLGEGAMGQAGATHSAVQVSDVLDDREPVAPQVRNILARLGYRSLLAIPLLREQRLLGGLVVWRQTSGSFTPEVVNLLQTLAAQSVLAIQNARLFQEIQEKSQELGIANQHKSEFLANMSHELRTPLNAIIGFSEVLHERMFGDLNAKQAEYVEDIHSSGQHLLSLINDILDLSKIEAGRMELHPSRFALAGALGNVMTLVHERAARHGIDLDLKLDPRLDNITADELKFKQIMLNLLSNAVKFTPEGGRITVSAGPSDDGVQIAVADTGIGIAPEQQQEIFEAFRQGHGEHAGTREGTGLGLALTRRFVELHGGTIRVESAAGKGSTFTVTLPAHEPGEAPCQMN